MISFAALMLVLQSAAALAVPSSGVQDAAYGPDGRLALAIEGNIWVQRSKSDAGNWVQVTSGPQWDREPAWSADGKSIVFASLRDGQSHLYRVQVPVGNESAVPSQRVDDAGEWESNPALAPDGTLAFVRGLGPTARVYIRTTDGKEHRLTKSRTGAEDSPAFAPDGKHLAFVTVTETGGTLRVIRTDGDSSRTVVSNRDVQHPVWSPDGRRIAFGSRSGPAGVWVTSSDGDYVNLVSDRRAAPSWAPDGTTLALVELPPPPPGYNGDPDRLGDRGAGAMLKETGTLWYVSAPAVPDSGNVAEFAVAADNRSRNAEQFDAAWQRTDRLYYSGTDAAPRHAAWEKIRDTFRPRALAAKSPAELANIVHEMLLRRPPLREPATGRAAVSSANPVSTAAGVEILRKGGNVVDAAVAVSFALGVVEPDASGIGGYGEMLIRLDSMQKPVVIEFMTRLPQDFLSNEHAVMVNGRYPDDGPVLPNVPGTIAGMHKAWQEYGSHKVSWADIVAPAIRAAKNGYVVSDGLATTLATEREHFMKYEGSRKLFFPNGKPLQAGDTLRNPDLAWALQQIADSGAAAVYGGAVGRRMVADLRGHGNAMRMSDLERYYAAEREPVAGTYRGFTVYSSTPPVSGGATLVAQLNNLEQVPHLPSYTEDAAAVHAMIESWKLVPSSRGRIADPGLWPVNTTAFTSKDSARARWNCFSTTHSLTSTELTGDTPKCAKPRGESTKPTGTSADFAQATGGGTQPQLCGDLEAEEGEADCHRTGTTAFTVADANGNVVAVTQTLGTWGGSFYVSPGLGFLYNDKLTSYSNSPAGYGSRAPYERNGSTLAPTLVFKGSGASLRPVLAVGAAGNSWITSAVYSIVSGVLDQKLDVQRAIELPRFLLSRDRVGNRTDYMVEMEDGFSPSAERNLESFGHHLRFISLPGELRMGYAAAITIGDKSVTAGADPRRSGTAGAVNP